MPATIKTAPAQGPIVNFKREEITALEPRWTLIRDCLSGDKAVKDKGQTYLPKPNAADTSDENNSRYEAYKKRAVFYNVTARTLRGLCGQVFARDPVIKLPSTIMKPIQTDVNGAGIGIDQQARKALERILAHGRCGILVDYPTVAAPATMAQAQAGEIRPTICLYDPWDVINWRTITVGSKILLSLVVISEKDVVDDDGFEAKHEEYFRVLRLTGGIYHSQIWYFDNAQNAYVMESDIVPLDGSGKPWNEIPFSFIGSENNDSTPDLPPLYDMAVLNIAHYCNSADYEESCFMVGQPTPYFAGLTEQWVTKMLKGTIQLGSRGAVPLPEGGTAGLLQAEPNSMPKEAMEHKERQMVALGAKLVEQTTVQRTATEAGMEEASTTSLLGTCAKNVSHAYTFALKWCAKFLNVVIAEDGADCNYELNTEFDLARLGAQDIAAVVAAWQAQAISFTELRGNLKAGGIAWLDDDEAQEEIESQPPNFGLPGLESGTPGQPGQQGGTPPPAE